nr:ribonuclease H-like domain-containing protein [Tanacetum cinerariifolium]
MSVRTKRGLGLDKYIGEGELGNDDSKFSIFHTNSDELEGQPIYNRFASVDQMKAVPPPLTGNYMPPSNISDIDESQMVYGKKATDTSVIKTNDVSISHSNDSVLFDFSDRSSEPSTNDLQTCDSSMECSRPNHNDHDSTDSISSKSAPTSESRDTIVIDCDRQKDFPSVCSIETDVKSSKTLCNNYLHLIKDCDLHEQRFAKNAEGKGILGRRPTGKPQNPVSAGPPNPVSAGQQNPVSAGPPNPISAEQQNTVFAGQPNPISADFPFPDPGMVILSIPRKHNLYTFNLNELAPKGPLTYLIAKASQNESTLWHRRLDSDDEPDVLIIHSTPTPVVPIVDEATTQNVEQARTEEADRLGLAFLSLNLILGVDSASIGSSISAGSTPPISAGSTPPMSSCASPI